MNILGETKPLTNKSYTYTLRSNNPVMPWEVGTNKFIPSKVPVVLEWELQYNGRTLQKNKSGTFRFATNLAGKTLTLIVRTKQDGKEVPYEIKLTVLAGPPRITSVKWIDRHGETITKGSKVGYLDFVKLRIQTLNIPAGEKLSISIFEDDSHRTFGAKSRKLETLLSTPIDKQGYAELRWDSMSAYQMKLNKADFNDEWEHHYFVQIIYHTHINRIEKGIQLVVRNKLESLIKAPQTNSPVQVQQVNSTTEGKNVERVNVVFNMFFDGTANNMTNTRARLEPNLPDVFGVFAKKSNKKDDSYMNFYSNIALLYMTNDVDENDDIISIYTEGIGTKDKERDQVISGKGMAIASTGILAKVNKSLAEMLERAKEKYFDNKIQLGKVTINVLGFSRGAAAARYFISQKHGICSFLKKWKSRKEREEVSFNFIGLFDTVASHWFRHSNDVTDLNMEIGGNAKKVFHLVAADEYRLNYSLSDIKSSIKAGVGYELSLPGVHSDVGGGYDEWEIERRLLGKESNFKKDGINTKLEQLKKQYIAEGWYRADQLKIETLSIPHKRSGLSIVYSYVHKLYGLRNDNNLGIPNTYQYIPLAIMKDFCKKYTDMKFEEDKIKEKYDVGSELQSIKNLLYNYAVQNDGINSLKVTVVGEELRWLRNKYLHRSNNDESLVMKGHYDDNKPERGLLDG